MLVLRESDEEYIYSIFEHVPSISKFLIFAFEDLRHRPVRYSRNGSPNRSSLSERVESMKLCPPHILVYYLYMPPGKSNSETETLTQTTRYSQHSSASPSR